MKVVTYEFFDSPFDWICAPHLRRNCRHSQPASGGRSKDALAGPCNFGFRHRLRGTLKAPYSVGIVFPKSDANKRTPFRFNGIIPADRCP